MKNRKLNGYNLIYKPEHPSSMKNKNWNGYVYEHLYVYEKAHNIIVPNGYCVHHIDGNKENNIISNLVMLSLADHVKIHSHMNRAFENESLKMNWMNSGKPKYNPLFKLDKESDKIAYKKFLSDLNIKRVKSSRSGNELDVYNIELVIDKLIENRFNFSKTSKLFEISDNGLRKRLFKNGLDTAILSQAKSQLLEGATTTGEVKALLMTRLASNA